MHSVLTEQRVSGDEVVKYSFNNRNLALDFNKIIY